MSFTKEQLQKFTRLIRIKISDEENLEIDSVIEWLDILKKIDTTGVEPMLTPIEHEMVLREDIVTDGNIRDKILANVPDDAGKAQGYFAVPKVIE